MEVVADSLRQLLRERIHPTFAGYLCLKRTAARDRKTTGLKPDFREFFETFLRVPGGSEKQPYLRPFWNEKRSARKAWYQTNIAGTYSPGSARRIKPFMSVVDIEGAGAAGTYSLRPDHWALARTHLAYGGQIPMVPLAVFLYRDYAVLSDQMPRAGDVARIFRSEFGYPASRAETGGEFEHLYRDDSATVADTDWFEAAG